MRVVLPFGGGLVTGALLAFGSRACGSSLMLPFPSYLLSLSLLALVAGLIALPIYAGACIFLSCCLAKAELAPISWKPAWFFGMAIPMFGVAVLGLVGVTCRSGMPIFAFVLPAGGVIYGSDSQPEVWGITLGLLSSMLLAGVAPMFLLNWAATPAVSSHRGAAKWGRILLAAMFVAIVAVTAAAGGFWLAHAIGGSNQTAERVAITVVWGVLGVGAAISSNFLVDWSRARRLASGLRVVKRSRVVLPALLLALVAIAATEHIRAYVFERDCLKLAHWLGAHQKPGSYSAVPLPGEFARLSSDGSTDVIVRPDSGVVLVLKTQWWEWIYSTSSNVPPEIKIDSFGRQYLPISGNPAHLIDKQLNGHLYVGEAWYFPLQRPQF